MMLANPKKYNMPIKHMEVISLGVLKSLNAKNSHLFMIAIMELPQNQLEYIKQIAEQHADDEFNAAL